MKHHPECSIAMYGPCCTWLPEECNCQCDCDRIEEIYQRGFTAGLLQAATYAQTRGLRGRLGRE